MCKRWVTSCKYYKLFTLQVRLYGLILESVLLLKNMDQKLTNFQIVQLIKLYRSQPLLWDMNNKDYRRNDLKAKAYAHIASKMGLGISPDVLKKKLRSLRTTYTGEKRKIYDTKISGAEELYVPTLAWFKEMSFLDNSITLRKNYNISNEDSCSSRVFDVFEKVECDDFFPKEKPEEETPKINEAPEKIINISDKDNEFTAFATSISYQLQKFSEEDAYKLMAEIQNLLTQRKLKKLRGR